VIPIEETDKECNIWLFEDICVPSTGVVAKIEKLIDHVFPLIDHNMANMSYMTYQAIFSNKN
jgi:hypothetical protein